MKEGEIIAIEVKEEEDGDTLDCGSMSLFRFIDSNPICKILPSTL